MSSPEQKRKTGVDRGSFLGVLKKESLGRPRLQGQRRGEVVFRVAQDGSCGFHLQSFNIQVKDLNYSEVSFGHRDPFSWTPLWDCPARTTLPLGSILRFSDLPFCCSQCVAQSLCRRDVWKKLAFLLPSSHQAEMMAECRMG